MGMDWHSSGITTSVLGALKRGLGPVEHELGVHVCGGRGRHSRKTPDELRALGERIGFDGDALAHTSKLVAKVDSAAVQDGYQLYLHGFVVADDGKWVVVQQGMRPEAGTARRYHWLSEGVRDFVDEPHSAIDGVSHGDIVNLTDRRAETSRRAQLELVARGPDAVLPHLIMPRHHDVRPSDVLLRRLRGTIAAAAERAPIDFADLLMTPGLGARTVEALAAVAEVVHGAPCRFTDPARFALAHGGKDGHPFPVPLRVYDQTIAVMRRAVDAAKLGNDERLAAVKRLDAEARRMESIAASPTFEDYVADNVARSDEYGGRTVFDDRNRAVRKADDRKPDDRKQKRQLELFTAMPGRPAAAAPTRRPAPHPTVAAPSSRRATRGSA
jgi:hypothetical protein